MTMTDRELAGCAPPERDELDEMLAAAEEDMAALVSGYAWTPVHMHQLRGWVRMIRSVRAARSRTPSSEGDGRDAERYRWLRKNDNADLLAEDVIDEAIAAAAGGGRV